MGEGPQTGSQDLTPNLVPTRDERQKPSRVFLLKICNAEPEAFLACKMPLEMQPPSPNQKQNIHHKIHHNLFQFFKGL